MNDTSAIPDNAFPDTALISQNQSSVFGNVISRGNAHDHGDTTPVNLNSLVKRAAEPCAAGKPCPDKRYAFLIMLLAYGRSLNMA